MSTVYEDLVLIEDKGIKRYEIRCIFHGTNARENSADFSKKAKVNFINPAT